MEKLITLTVLSLKELTRSNGLGILVNQVTLKVCFEFSINMPVQSSLDHPPLIRQKQVRFGLLTFWQSAINQNLNLKNVPFEM